MIPLLVSRAEENDDSDDEEEEEEEGEEEEERKYYKRKGFTRPPPSNPRKKNLYNVFRGYGRTFAGSKRKGGYAPSRFRGRRNKSYY